LQRHVGKSAAFADEYEIARAAIAAIPSAGGVEEAARLARIGREHLWAGTIDDALTAFNRIAALGGGQ
jgi:hypothetical protein